MWNETDIDVGGQSFGDVIEASSLATGVLIFLMILWTTGGYLLANRCRFLGEGSVASLLGLLAGLAILVAHNRMERSVVRDLLIFDSASFFTYLLPPIIFYAGLSVEKKQFFRNIFSIMNLGVLGTFLSFVFLSLILVGFSNLSDLITVQDCLALGAIFSATDSIATLQILQQDKMPLLYSLVFGEGVVNDATSVVLLRTVQELGDRENGIAGIQVGSILSKFLYLFILSLLLGVACGLVTSYLIKKLNTLGTQQEISLVALMAYFSYLLGEVLGLSGILTIFFCAVCVSHYALQSMPASGRGCAIQVFRTASYLAEGVIFIYVGMDSLDVRKWQAAEQSTAFWLVAVLLTILAITRASFVIPVACFHNYCSFHKLAVKDVIIIWWSGMMRGAVSVALVYYYFDPQGTSRSPHKSTLIVATVLAVLFSTLILGAVTKPLLQYLLQNYSDEHFLQNSGFSLPFTRYIKSVQSMEKLQELKRVSITTTTDKGDDTIDSDDVQEASTSDDNFIQSNGARTENQQDKFPNIAETEEETVALMDDRRVSVDPNSLAGKLLDIWDQFDRTIMQPTFGCENESQSEEVQQNLESNQSIMSFPPAMQISVQQNQEVELANRMNR